MKRIYLAVALLLGVAMLCVGAHRYQHVQIDRMLDDLSRIEAAARRGDTDAAVRDARRFAAEYQRVSDWISCYVAHDELRESRETAALIPVLLEDANWEELFLEIARLRAQLNHIRAIDDPLPQNIL